MNFLMYEFSRIYEFFTEEKIESYKLTQKLIKLAFAEQASMKLPFCVCSAVLMLVQSNLLHWSGLLHGWVQSELFHWSGLGSVLHGWPECCSRAEHSECQPSWPNPKKKLINKTQEFPIALNISICTNLFVNGLMTVAASSVYPIMTEAASSVYPNQMLITHWLTIRCVLSGGLIGQTLTAQVLSDQQMSKSQINEQLDQVHLFCLSVCKMDLKAASSLVHPGNGGGVVGGWVE